MKNFKPGQKVVFYKQPSWISRVVIAPKEGEVITLKCRCSVDPNAWNIVEYPIAKNGSPQSVHENHLFQIQEKPFPSIKLKEQVKEILELESHRISEN